MNTRMEAAIAWAARYRAEDPRISKTVLMVAWWRSADRE